MSLKKQKHFQLSDVEVIDRQIAFKGFFQVDKLTLKHRLFDGGWSQPMHREVFERGHAAAVLPWDPATDQVLLIEQLRVGAVSAGDPQPWLLEIIAGMLDKPDENPAEVAYREAVEEANCSLLDIEAMMDYWSSPGGCSEKISLFCGRMDASKIHPGIFGLASEHEDIKVHLVDFSEAIELLAQGRLNNAATVIAVQWLQLNKQKLKAAWGIS